MAHLLVELPLFPARVRCAHGPLGPRLRHLAQPLAMSA